jgi:hypothetical protein
MPGQLIFLSSQPLILFVQVLEGVGDSGKIANMRQTLMAQR